MFCISVVSAVGCPRLMNFGLSLKTELARFTRPLELDFLKISGKILFKPTSLMHNNSRFISLVVEP